MYYSGTAQNSLVKNLLKETSLHTYKLKVRILAKLAFITQDLWILIFTTV